MKCATCVRPDSTCLGERLSHLCGNPEYRVYFSTYEQGTNPKFGRSHHEALKLLILGCDYRGGPVLECGCTNTRVCLMGKGKPIPGSPMNDVTYNDCHACVSS